MWLINPLASPVLLLVMRHGSSIPACWKSVQKDLLQLQVLKKPLIFHTFLLQLHLFAAYSTAKKPGLNWDDSFRTVWSLEDVIILENVQPWACSALKSGGLSSLGKIYGIWEETIVIQMNCDILIRCLRSLLDIEQRRFLKGASNLERSWLIIVCALGDQKICGGQGRKSWVGLNKEMGEKSYLRENLAYIWYLCLFFSWNGLMCWQEASGCCQGYEHLCSSAEYSGF